MITVRIPLLVPLLACSPAADATADGSDTTASSTAATVADAGEMLQSCVAAGDVDLDLVFEPAPPELGQQDLEYHGPCTVASVSDAAVTLTLACMQGDAPLAFSLRATGLADTALEQQFASGAEVELDYATWRGISGQAAWVALRRQGEATPGLVALAGWQPKPWFGADTEFMAPFAVEFVGATDCETVPGACNIAPKRRAAVRVSLPDEDPITVFDRNESTLAGYRVVVGEATDDQGNCEGVSATWYEVVIVAASP